VIGTKQSPEDGPTSIGKREGCEEEAVVVAGDFNNAHEPCILDLILQ
jgi:hypothetical protein